MAIKYYEATDYEGLRFFPKDQKAMLEQIAKREGMTISQAELELVKIADQASDADYNKRA